MALQGISKSSPPFNFLKSVMSTWRMRENMRGGPHFKNLLQNS